MTQVERCNLVDHWAFSIQTPYLDDVLEAHELWTDAQESQASAHEEIDARCLKQADVIGVATSGMARYSSLIRSLNSKVVVCEEAGEVLEAHILTALLPTVEHAILIGDHLQLRPQISNYELQSTHVRGKQYSLDVSLFERLVNPFNKNEEPLPFTMLQTQRRMHPQISELIRSTLYPGLEDAEYLGSYPEVQGLRRRLFWMTHTNNESAKGTSTGMDSSYSNKFEADMVLGLVIHLVRQGCYSKGDIAVLTPYKAQFRLLQARLGSVMEVCLNELDQAEEDADAIMDSNYQPSSIGKKPLASSVRVATVDNFQGEEAKVVVVSLVRSNKDRHVGFLKTSNRINVLLSRAKHGMYIFGDATTVTTVPMWNQVIDVLGRQGNIGPDLALQCPRHPEKLMLVSKPDHFRQVSPDGGCELQCGKRLNCGHICRGRCHSDIVHKAVKCLEQCTRPKAGCDHQCPLLCGDPCQAKCMKRLENLDILLKCGHKVTTARCWNAQDPQTIVCQFPVTKIIPHCEHVLETVCSNDVNGSGFVCKSSCRVPLPCGHDCKQKCSDCKVKERDDRGLRDHGACKSTCGRQYTNCRHSCRHKCHDGTPCQPCAAPCEVECSHSRCSKPCNEPCPPCADAVCASRCVHKACTMP